MAALRAVEVGEKARPARPKKTVAEAAAGGNRRELLVAMRDRIARAVAADDCPPRDLASLTRRLQDIAKEIESIDASEQEGEHAQVDDGEFDPEAI